MSGLTDDQIAALYEWATHHPRLERALTAGMLADLHGVVADMLATADCSPESAQTVAREVRPTPQQVVDQIADRMRVGNPDATEAAILHGFMQRLDAPTTVARINEVVCRVMIEDGPDGHTDGSDIITAAALAEVKRLLTVEHRRDESKPVDNIRMVGAVYTCTCGRDVVAGHPCPAEGR